MKELWDRSLKPEHFIGGFKASGLFPLNLDAISKVKFATSIPFANSTAPSASTVKTTQYITDLQCTDCGRDMTPVKLHVQWWPISQDTYRHSKNPGVQKIGE